MLNKASGDVEQQLLHAFASALLNVDLLQQSTNGLSGLSTGLDPLTGPVSVDLDLSGRHAGVVEMCIRDRLILLQVSMESLPPL